MADYKHVNTADYEDRAYKLNRAAAYKKLLSDLGYKPDQIKDEKIPQRDFGLLEELASQPSNRPYSLASGVHPMSLVDYADSRGFHQGELRTYRDNDGNGKVELNYPSYEHSKWNYKNLYNHDQDLLYNPDKYLKNLNPSRIRAERQDRSADASYHLYKDIIQMNANSSYFLDSLVHENEHRNQFKYPKDAFPVDFKYDPPLLGLDNSYYGKGFLTRQANYDQSIDKQLNSLEHNMSPYGFSGYTGQPERMEKLAEIRRLQSLQKRQK